MVPFQEKTNDFTTCRQCHKTFNHLIKHLVQKEDCRKLYSEDEMKALSKVMTAARKKRHHNENHEKLVQKNRVYNEKNREVKAQKQKLYDQKNRAIKVQKQRLYDQKKLILSVFLIKKVDPQKL